MGLIPQKSLGVRHSLQQEPARLAHTVDSFQGNQADIVIISLVRNNNSQPRHGLGFLNQRERMNVLISRAGRLLVIVGSWSFFQFQLSEVTINEAGELSHWKHLLTEMQSMFESGEAVRIPFSAHTKWRST